MFCMFCMFCLGDRRATKLGGMDRLPGGQLVLPRYLSVIRRIILSSAGCGSALRRWHAAHRAPHPCKERIACVSTGTQAGGLVCLVAQKRDRAKLLWGEGRNDGGPVGLTKGASELPKSSHRRIWSHIKRWQTAPSDVTSNNTSVFYITHRRRNSLSRAWYYRRLTQRGRSSCRRITARSLPGRALSLLCAIGGRQRGHRCLSSRPFGGD